MTCRFCQEFHSAELDIHSLHQPLSMTNNAGAHRHSTKYRLDYEA
jgi:hypothetical protein